MPWERRADRHIPQAFDLSCALRGPTAGIYTTLVATTDTACGARLGGIFER